MGVVPGLTARSLMKAGQRKDTTTMATKRRNSVGLTLRASRHIGVAYPVRRPKFTDDLPEREDAQALTVVRCTTVTGWDDAGHPVLGIALNGQQVISLNPDTATALGLALIAEADGWREVVRED